MAENQNLKDLNNQLRDLLSTYNAESKKLREDFERRELDYQNKVAELNKALILQEKKMVDKVIESIEMKHQSYHGRGTEFEYMNRMDEEFDKLKNKRKEITKNLEEPDELEVPIYENIAPQPAKKTTERLIPKKTKQDLEMKKDLEIPHPTKLEPGKAQPQSQKFSNSPTPPETQTKKLSDEIDDFDDFEFD